MTSATWAQWVKWMDSLGGDSPSDLRGAFEGLPLQGRAPLYQILTMPFLLAFGRSVRAALGVNLAFQVLLLVSVYALGQRLAGRPAGLLAALMTAAYPPLIHLSHIYRPHFAVAACVTTSLWLLLRLLEDRTQKRALGFGASLGFGLLLRASHVSGLRDPEPRVPARALYGLRRRSVGRILV